MLHLGDITKISGYTAPIVDVVVGGSPCQDLSTAGKKAGLNGERSGLFMDQVRIVKEMRDRDVRDNGRSGVDVRPRYLVWENVPGAFSSNKGEDFHIVLEEIARIKDENAVIPRPERWETGGCILGRGWSIAWRVLDAQFWGVPQRRRRIALVADFGGQSAPEILFVRKGVSGHSQPSESERKAVAQDATRGVGADDCEPKLMDAYQHHGYRESDTCGTLTAGQNGGIRGDTPLVTAPVFCIDGDKLNKKERNGGSGMGIREGNQYTLTAKDVHGVAYDSAAYTMKIRSGCDVDANGKPAGKGALIQTEKSGTLSCVQDQYLFQPVGADQYNAVILGDSVSTLGVNGGMSHGRQCVLEPAVCYSLDPLSSNSMKSSNPHSGCHETAVARTIDTTYPDPSKNQGGVAVVAAVDCRNGTEADTNGALQSMASNNINSNNVVRTRYTVRRLTPLECERLQGYPDGWTDIGEYIDSNGRKKQSSDAARYKALGNSIAIPPWKWVMKRLCACYERDATLASLFDGIGGFPYIWEQINGKGSCLWASEIEEFPMAVTKVRIG